jgi:hypothetical protein
MKTLLLLLLFSITNIGLKAQLLLSENFKYNTGHLTSLNEPIDREFVGGGKWVRTNSPSYNLYDGSLWVSEGSLNYLGYESDNLSNKLSISDLMTGECSSTFFKRQDTGTVYVSFLVNVSKIDSGLLPIGRYIFMSVFEDSTRVTFGSPTAHLSSYSTTRIYLQNAKNNTFQINLEIYDSGRNVPSLYPIEYMKFETTHLFVLSHSFNDDSLRLYINPTPNNPRVSYTIFNGKLRGTNMLSIYNRINAGSVPRPTFYSIDALKVGKSWKDIMGTPTYKIGQINSANKITGLADSVGLKVSIKGVVHRYNQTNGSLKFLLHDGTGGITIKSTKTFGYTVGEGDSLEVKGIVDSERGLVILNIDTLIVINQENPIQIPTTINNLGESTENKLVAISNLKFITKPAATWQVGIYQTINTITKDTIPLILLASSPLIGKLLPLKFTFKAIGIGTQLSSSTIAPYTFNGYGLIPMKLNDIVYQDSITSVEEIIDPNFSFFPNPANDKITINTHTSNTYGDIKIIDNNGKTVFSKSNSDFSALEIDITHLANGIYCINLKSSKGLINYKFIKNSCN